MKGLQPRGYQKAILERSNKIISKKKNPIIELDCGMGKRYLQMAMITDSFSSHKIILLLQASASLYETYEYMKNHSNINDIAIIDSRQPSKLRARILKATRIVLCLPQTLLNTLKKKPQVAEKIDLIIINEIDQIIRRMGATSVLKQPYNKLLEIFEEKSIIGMSGTLRDNHYILDSEQIRIKKELQSLTDNINNAVLISMDSLDGLENHTSFSQLIPTSVDDPGISLLSMELELEIKDIKQEVLKELLEEDPVLYYDVIRDQSKLFGPLPIQVELINRFHKAYLVRKYLWAMTPTKAAIHLIAFGLNKKYVWDTMPKITAKHKAVLQLASQKMKTVVLCSYLDTVDFLEDYINQRGIRTVKISGKVKQQLRVERLDLFRKSDDQMVALLSSVGERDLDIPEADLLIIFDLINTTKTVYQKLKRSRDGDCRIIQYKDTNEIKKAKRVIDGIMERYPWSVKLAKPDLI